MNLAEQIKLNKQLEYHRILLSVVGALLLIINLLLSLYIFLQDKQTIIVPSFIPREFNVTTKTASSEYIELMARDIAMQVLNLTQENYEYTKNSLLRIAHPTSYGQLKTQLDELATDIRDRNLSINFTISNIVVDQEGQSAQVSGYLETKVGSKTVSRDLKTYSILFSYVAGTLTLRNFFEVAHE